MIQYSPTGKVKQVTNSLNFLSHLRSKMASNKEKGLTVVSKRCYNTH
jgi:hypothetical protein